MRQRVEVNPSEVPPPGSGDAIASGCLCARLDNNHGRGYHHDRYGRPLYIVSEECPLHRTEREELAV